MRNWTRCLMNENGTVTELLVFTQNEKRGFTFHYNNGRVFGFICTFEVWKNNRRFPKTVGKILGKMISAPKAREIWKQQNDNQAK